MCGIAGFVGEGSEADIRAMATALVHRGPDEEGYFLDAGCRLFLGHRRLAILDKAGGKQPMWDASGNVCVVFNGEIYNHRELRQTLQEKGHTFLSDHSDTETLIYGYLEWGEQLPLHLNGMFAFAIYDRRGQRLFLARDRFGEKPLFWSATGSGLAFASELPALLKHPSLSAHGYSAMGLRKFFAYSFFPGEWTQYEGIRKLKAGHSLTYDLRTGRSRTQRYWKFAIQPFTGALSPQREGLWAEELRDLLGRSVRMRLESDVPLGIFLSGGIDSSAVLALAAEHVPSAELHGFSIGFTEPSFDESAYARRMASYVGCQHHIRICDLDSAKDLLPGIMRSIGDPLGDPSLLPTYMLCQFAREKVTVALSGDGGDELFAGYDPVRALAIAQHYHRLMPSYLHPLVRWLVALMPKGSANLSLDFKLRRGLRGVGFPPHLWNPLWMGALEPSELESLFVEKADVEEIYSEAITLWHSCASESLLDRTIEFFANLYLQDDILVKTDRASMQTSLEVRAPFLDNDVVDFARRLPPSLKYRNGTTKYLLKKALAATLPDDILNRRKKGFGIPLTSWLRDIPSPQAGGRIPLNAHWLAERWRRHAIGKEDNRNALFCWLALVHGSGKPEGDD